MTHPYTDWATRHPAAAAELHALLHALDAPPVPATTPKPGSEAAVSNLIRLEASRRGWGCWRNNKGVLPDARGVPVRFGLANDSPQVGRTLRSADLILCIPTLITLQHVGTTLGRYGSAEVKRADWRYTGTEHEVAQEAWAARVRSLGGWACAGVTSVEQLP